MATDDKGNYGTPISYAIPQEDNEITFTDPFGFVLSVKGKENLEIPQHPHLHAQCDSKLLTTKAYIQKTTTSYRKVYLFFHSFLNY